jgi:hypothetical protein
MAPEPRPEPKLDEIRQRPPDVPPGEEIKPDPRLTFANERTFLAWNRTALALVAGGLAAAQYLTVGPMRRGWSYLWCWSCSARSRPSGATGCGA